MEMMSAAELNQLRDARHGSVVFHHLTDNARGIEARKLSEIYGGFCLSGAAQNPSSGGPQRKDMTGTSQIVRPGRGVNGR